jgi:SAM-dependent methyltransferase
LIILAQKAPPGGGSAEVARRFATSGKVKDCTRRRKQSPLMSIFKETYAELEPMMKDIVAKVRAVPPDRRPGTKHIDHIECMMQYAFYTALVREWLPDTGAEILDWGGQHGQVSLMLSRYYPNTTCYVLEGDVYDSNYGLSDWHRLLGVGGVVRSGEPKRIMVSKEFDAAISSGVLEHVEECGGDYRASLAELHRVLRPDGLLFIWNLPRYYGREFLYPLIGRHAHSRRYHKREIVDALGHSGFEILYMSAHELLSCKALKLLGAVVPADKLIAYDYRLSEHLPWLAQNYTIVARRK